MIIFTPAYIRSLLDRACEDAIKEAFRLFTYDHGEIGDTGVAKNDRFDNRILTIKEAYAYAVAKHCPETA